MKGRTMVLVAQIRAGRSLRMGNHGGGFPTALGHAIRLSKWLFVLVIVTTTTAGSAGAATEVSLADSPYEPFRPGVVGDVVEVGGELVFSDGLQLVRASLQDGRLRIVSNFPWSRGVSRLFADQDFVLVSGGGGWDLLRLESSGGIERVCSGRSDAMGMAVVGNTVLVLSEDSLVFVDRASLNVLRVLSPHDWRGIARHFGNIYLSRWSEIEVHSLTTDSTTQVVGRVESDGADTIWATTNTLGQPVLLERKWDNSLLRVYSLLDPFRPALLAETAGGWWGRMAVGPGRLFRDNLSGFEIGADGTLIEVLGARPLASGFEARTVVSGRVFGVDRGGIPALIRSEVLQEIADPVIPSREVEFTGPRAVWPLDSGFAVAHSGGLGIVPVSEPSPVVQVIDGSLQPISVVDLADGILVAESDGVTALSLTPEVQAEAFLETDAGCAVLTRRDDVVAGGCGHEVVLWDGGDAGNLAVSDRLDVETIVGHPASVIDLEFADDDLLVLTQQGELIAAVVLEGEVVLAEVLDVSRVPGTLSALASDGTHLFGAGYSGDYGNREWALSLLERTHTVVQVADSTLEERGSSQWAGRLQPAGDMVCSALSTGALCYSVRDGRLVKSGEYRPGAQVTGFAASGNGLGLAQLDGRFEIVNRGSVLRVETDRLYETVGFPQALWVAGGNRVIADNGETCPVITTVDHPSDVPRQVGDLGSLSRLANPQAYDDRWIAYSVPGEIRVATVAGAGRVGQYRSVEVGVDVYPPFCVVDDSLVVLGDGLARVFSPGTTFEFTESESFAFEPEEGDTLESITCGDGWFASVWWDFLPDGMVESHIQGYLVSTIGPPTPAWQLTISADEPSAYHPAGSDDHFAFFDPTLPGPRVVDGPTGAPVFAAVSEGHGSHLIVGNGFVGFEPEAFRYTVLATHARKASGAELSINMPDFVRAAAADGGSILFGLEHGGVWEFPLHGWIGMPPDSRFGADPEPVTLGAAVRFRLHQPCPRCDVVWDFGDGTGSAQVAPSHRYSEPGLFRVQVEVTDKGQTSRSGKLIRVNQVENHAAVPPATVAIPAVAHATGANQSEWRTDVSLTNASIGPVAVRVSLRGVGEAVDIEVPSFGTAVYGDIVEDVFGVTQFAGICDIHTPDESDFSSLLVDAVTYAVEGDDRFGLRNPVVRNGDITSDEKSAVMASGDGFRWNLFAVGDPETWLTVAALAANGDTLAESAYRVDVSGYLQVNDIKGKLLRGVDLSGREPVLLSASATTGFYAFASIVDNSTNDSTVVPLRAASDVEEAVWGLAASTSGVSAEWRSTAWLGDRFGCYDLTELTFFDGSIGRRDVAIGHGGFTALELGDITRLAGAEEGDEVFALLRLTPGCDQTGFIRIFNDLGAVGGEGTFGQGIEFVGPGELITPGIVGWFPAVEESQDRRTNLGFVNPFAVSALVGVSMLDQDGGVLDSFSTWVAPQSVVQFNRVLRRLPADARPAARTVTVEVTAGYGVAAYDSRVFASTDDPVFRWALVQ
jgi:PKD repeat protein